MGFFDWLKGKPKTVEVVDMIWLTPEAKFAGARSAMQQELERAPLVLAVAHFPTTLVQLADDCASNGLPHFFHEARLTTADIPRLARGPQPRILLTLAETLVVNAFLGYMVENAEPLPIIVVERHFLRANDDKVMAFAAALGRRCRLSFHLSLRDPLMQRFAGDWVQNVLLRLGMKESDAIESAMVARRVKAAQHQFAKLALGDRKADSAEQWLQLNVPQNG